MQDTTSFRALHRGPGAFIIPNPWDTGSARILAAMGFPALATTSAGMAFALGIPEGSATRNQILDHCRQIVSATPPAKCEPTAPSGSRRRPWVSPRSRRTSPADGRRAYPVDV